MTDQTARHLTAKRRAPKRNRRNANSGHASTGNGRRKPLSNVPIRTILAWHVGEDGSSGENPAVQAKSLRPLIAEYPTETVADLVQKRVDAYVGTRMKTVSGRTGETYSRKTAQGEMYYLASVANAYGRVHRLLPHAYRFKFKAIPTKVVQWTPNRNEIKRLLRASTGATWCPRTRTMQRGKSSEERKRYVFMARFILLAVVTGTGESCARRLRWATTPDGKTSYIDLDAGLLYRRGPDASDYPRFAGVPVQIAPWLLRHLRRWHAYDARHGRQNVIHGASGKPRTQLLSKPLRKLVERAGLKDVPPQTLVDAFVATAIRLGEPIYRVAIAVGIGPLAVRHRFQHLQPTFQDEGMEAFALRPTSTPNAGGRSMAPDESAS